MDAKYTHAMTDSDGTLPGRPRAIQRNPRLRILIPMVVAIAFLMEQLDATIITTAIPNMSRSLGVTPVRMNLAVTSYVLTLAVFIPVSGWFADRFGARRIFILALAIFTIGSALCGAVDNFFELVGTRILQGLGGAMMTPVGRLILLRSFPRSELVRAMTYMALPAVIGPIMGPLLGGFLTTYASWRWIFYLNLPFGAIGIFLALRYLDDIREEAGKRFDFPGFLMVGAGFALLQFGMDNVGRPTLSTSTIALILVTAAALFWTFGYYARRVQAPAVDLALFRLRSFAVGTLAGGLCRVAMNATPFLLPLMLQIGFGMSPIGSGSLTFVGTIGILMVRFIIGRLLRAFGFEKMLVGSAIAASCVLAGFSLIGPQTPHWLIGCYVFVNGLVQALQFMTSNTLSYSDASEAQLSQATSLGGVIQQLTVSFGVSIGAMLLSLLSGSDHALTPAKFHAAFLIVALLPLLAIPGFMRLRPEDGIQVSGYRRRPAR